MRTLAAGGLPQVEIQTFGSPNDLIMRAQDPATVAAEIGVRITAAQPAVRQAAVSSGSPSTRAR